MQNGVPSLNEFFEAVVERTVEKVIMRLLPDLGTTGNGIKPRLLTVEQAAVYLGRTKAAVQHMIGSKRLPTVRDGYRVFLDIRELDRWIEANTDPAELQN